MKVLSDVLKSQKFVEMCGYDSVVSSFSSDISCEV
jgi:hypothetical protein